MRNINAQKEFLRELLGEGYLIDDALLLLLSKALESLFVSVSRSLDAYHSLVDNMVNELKNKDL